ncbi:hypothetical protein CGCVW01_v011476 [Colletotrichum viniferum]|nr:hypothetical protein CGCVW01_v011476 [Colletotrichum viniferum]
MLQRTTELSAGNRTLHQSSTQNLPNISSEIAHGGGLCGKSFLRREWECLSSVTCVIPPLHVEHTLSPLPHSVAPSGANPM